MKIREELIAEMAVIGCVKNPQAITMRECFECGGKYGSSCNAYRHAEKLHNAGYRKQSDVIDEFVERLKEENEISFRRYGKGIGISTIFRIADEMRQEVEK